MLQTLLERWRLEFILYSCLLKNDAKRGLFIEFIVLNIEKGIPGIFIY